MPVAPKRSFKGNTKIFDSNGNPITYPFQTTLASSSLKGIVISEKPQKILNFAGRGGEGLFLE